MIGYRHAYALRRSAERNQDFIEHIIVGTCLLIVLAILMGWL